MKNEKHRLVEFVKERFRRYREGRAPHEKRWEEAYYNTLGEYSPQVQGQWRRRETSGSRIFVRITRQKVRQACRHLEPALRSIKFSLVGDEGDREALSALKREIERALSLTRVSDQLVDLVWDAAWSGTGILRVPILGEVEEPNYTYDEVSGLWSPEAVPSNYPGVENVSLWNFYPDPESPSIEEAEGVIELHRLHPHRLRKMVELAGWLEEGVNALIEEGEASDEEPWESSIRGSKGAAETTRIKLLEYWGTIPAGLMRAAGVELPHNAVEDVEGVVIIGGDQLLKAAPNPWAPASRPYLRFRWEPVPHDFWGVGIAENIRDAQKMINGATRLLVDNKALAGNCMFEIDMEALLPGQDVTNIYPGKKWVLRPGAQGPALRPVHVPDVSGILLEMIQLFTDYADETSGVAAAQPGGPAARTATGLSIANSAALDAYRGTIRRLDDEVIEPLLERFYRWVMEFGDPNIPKSPAKVRAVSSTATQARELRSQRLLDFMGVVTSSLGKVPSAGEDTTLIERVDMERLLEELAETLEVRELIKTEKFING
ncbi:MAG: hypothetical protein C0609_01245 [Deltaproteobacteria bacterium]|nr:MAG: hypothetical protein C0609_01245 [Deltaproteobacteria bacterium]